MARILSGIKPTGQLTLGNYIGAIKNFARVQHDGEPFIFIADLHALTLPIDPKTLRNNSRDIAAYYLAAGLDPKTTTIFLQSSVHEHSELAIILQNYLYMGELSRMTQYKDKTQKMDNNAIGLGLFAYPVLMAADIVLYDAPRIPVGEDQVQHVELARDLVKRFNNRYGDVLVMPKAEVTKVGKRIMSLSDPTKKMSKSDPKGDIYLSDDLKTMRKKIMSAVTDLGHEVKYDVVNKPGISNLMTIYSALTNKTMEEIEQEFANKGYGDFKRSVADALINEMEPFKARYEQIINSGIVDEVLKEGQIRASKAAKETLKRVQQAVGLYTLK
ncbi:MAG: tryptophan--tRNA ligase [Bacillales bacterium]|nr:tryptophan--tRNA ligase [Bacillales bacterium]MDY6003132.1 tryptophan--tRNA ligase [Bacilli bacterium]